MYINNNNNIINNRCGFRPITRWHIQQRCIPRWPNILGSECRFCLSIPKLVFLCARSHTLQLHLCDEVYSYGIISNTTLYFGTANGPHASAIPKTNANYTYSMFDIIQYYPLCIYTRLWQRYIYITYVLKLKI